MFNLVQSETDKKYLFLNTVREIIIENPQSLEAQLDKVIELLMLHSVHEDENIRNIVAESLGRLTPVYEDDLSQTLLDVLTSSEACQKATIAKSMKYSGPKIQSSLILQQIMEGLFA